MLFGNPLFSNYLQAEHELQTQILLQDYQVSKAQLDVFQWKRRAAILQLRLDSQSEDTNHFQAAYKCLMEELKRQYKDSHWHEAQIKSLQVWFVVLPVVTTIVQQF